MERIFRRKVYDRLLSWKNTQNGRTAVLIEGARRVGKSTVVEAFARNEIDFLVSRDTKLHPIEVKSSGYNAHASLDAFCRKFSNIVDKRYLIYTKDLKKDAETLLLPAYMTPFI